MPEAGGLFVANRCEVLRDAGGKCGWAWRRWNGIFGSLFSKVDEEGAGVFIVGTVVMDTTL